MQAIAEKIQIKDLNLIKSKWRNLRDAYQKTVKTRRELEEMGLGSKYKEYKHEESLSFLYHHIPLFELRGTRKRKGSSGYYSSSSLKCEKYLLKWF